SSWVPPSAWVRRPHFESWLNFDVEAVAAESFQSRSSFVISWSWKLVVTSWAMAPLGPLRPRHPLQVGSFAWVWGAETQPLLQLLDQLPKPNMTTWIWAILVNSDGSGSKLRS